MEPTKSLLKCAVNAADNMQNHTGQGQIIEAKSISQNKYGNWVPAEEVPYYPTISQRILHIFGVHNWTWFLPESGSLAIDAGVDVHCVQCGIKR